MSKLTDAQAVLRRAWTRRRRALNQQDNPAADSALRVIRRYRDVVRKLKAAVRPNPCRRPTRTYLSTKGWDHREAIIPKRIVLHSTETAPGSGQSVSGYLTNGGTQADVHVVIDTKGELYRLVPDGRKAWHVAACNPDTLGIEQVGHAAQAVWPETQLRATAKQIACWSRKYGIPIRDARQGGTGVTTHASLPTPCKPGGRTDPGAAYPFARVLRYARRYR